jgi:8-oxo-dGTP diphosphatase
MKLIELKRCAHRQLGATKGTFTPCRSVLPQWNWMRYHRQAIYGHAKMGYRWIEKVGLAAFDGDRMLIVRKRGGTLFILPGGKPEGQEGDLATLSREIHEELGCQVRNPVLSGVFKDRAAGIENAVVVVRLYTGELLGAPVPQSEIEELAWLDIRKPVSLPLAPSIINGILPHLRRRARRSAASKSGEATSEHVQGLLELI